MADQLKRSLSFNDLLLFGVGTIIGSGGFNLIGNGILAGGAEFPLALGASALLFQGLSRVYQEAYTTFRTNTSESDMIAQQFGPITSKISEISIIAFNIICVSTILIICAKLLFPSGSWPGQVSFAILLLSMMSVFSLQGIDMNKVAMNAFSYTIIALMALASSIGIFKFTQMSDIQPIVVDAPDFTKSFIYFYFILAGFDALIKFSEEAMDPDKDIARSFYASNAISTILTAGVCFSFLVMFASKKVYGEDRNIVADIIGVALGKYAGEVVGLLSILLMVSTSFINFLATSRYMFSLGKEIPILSQLNENKVPWVSVVTTFLIATLGILVNNVFFMVNISDILLTITLLLVSAATTQAQITKGVVPLVEGITTLSLGAVLYACFNRV
ncbi:MAG: APC family permease [Bacteroidetes bacterium]|nr:APC family permease [bacterium]NBP66076.1 APC family permease [Bacteroidota bacterium]